MCRFSTISMKLLNIGMNARRYLLGLLILVVTTPLLAQNTLNDSLFYKSSFIKNDLEEINTSSLELRPLLTADGNSLYFSRRKETKSWRRRNEQDIFVAHRDAITGSWGEVERLDKPLNNKRWNAVASVNPNGKELVLFNTYKKLENVPLVRSVKQGGIWSAPQEIHIQDYENFSPYSDFFVDFKQRVLLMAIEPFETKGEQDLFVSFPNGETGWTKPVNMGTVINSEKSDFAPFMGADGKTLFFSSYGHNTHGGSDIFMSVRLDDSWINWSVPVNLGPGINTEGDENYFSIDQNFEYLYYTSQKAGQNQGNVIKVSLPKDFTAINGPVLANLSKEEVQKIIDSGNFKVSQIERDSITEEATFMSWLKEDSVAVPNRFSDGSTETKVLSVEKENLSGTNKTGNHSSEVKSLMSTEATAVFDYLQRELHGIDFSIILKGDTTEYKLVQDILFDFNSTSVNREYHQRLNVIADVLLNKEELKVQLIGHTDNIGSEDVNQRVAELRVKNVLLCLTGKSINLKRIEVIGAGQAKPVAPNETIGGRSLNRRVETIIRFIEDN